ncbi:MAG TPA: hypothetical protein DCE14_02840 [Kosmotogaceae bacterium]|nr:hypothetical protein [Kosmotogaceae bacterium]
MKKQTTHIRMLKNDNQQGFGYKQIALIEMSDLSCYSAYSGQLSQTNDTDTEAALDAVIERYSEAWQRLADS